MAEPKSAPRTWAKMYPEDWEELNSLNYVEAWLNVPGTFRQGKPRQVAIARVIY